MRSIKSRSSRRLILNDVMDGRTPAAVVGDLTDSADGTS
jgi:hypothetical protein